MTNQTITGSRLTGYIVNVMRSPVIERLMVRGSQVALKHVIHDMVTRTLVMELRRCAIKRWVPCGDMDRKLKIPHSAKVECGFRILPRNAYMIAVQSAFSIGTHNTILYNTIQSLFHDLLQGPSLPCKVNHEQGVNIGPTAVVSFIT